MTSTSPSAFALSATLHVTVVVLALLVGYATRHAEKIPPKVFELVAGEGNNFMATEAPAYGTPGGVKVAIPKPVEPPRPESAPVTPVAPTPVTPAPVAPAPTPKAVTPTVPKKDPSTQELQKNLKDVIRTAKSNATRQLVREEKKRLEEEKKRQAEEAKRLTKEEFDKLNKQRSAAPQKNTPTKIAKIDGEGIAKGVVGGSTANKIGGAGGTALTATEGDEAERFGAALLQRLKDALDNTPGLDDGLRAEAEFTITDEGRLIRGKITKSSRNKDFDRAVLDAITSIRMGYRPKGVVPNQTVPFSTHGRERG